MREQADSDGSGPGVGAQATSTAGAKALTGRAALVTGSSRGIGRAIALALAEAGADVAIHYRTSRGRAEEVARGVEAAGRRSLVVEGDVRHADQVGRLVRRAVDEFGRLDILVNNAGYALGRPLAETTPDDWDGQMTTLPRGYFLAAKAAAPHLAAVGGSVINIASAAGVRGDPGFAAYSAANGAILALTRALAAELGPRGVRVNAIVVAWATTEDNPLDPADPEHQRFLAQLALGRATSPEEIARAAVFLASGAASAITGVFLPVDGGYL